MKAFSIGPLLLLLLMTTAHSQPSNSDEAPEVFMNGVPEEVPGGTSFRAQVTIFGGSSPWRIRVSGDGLAEPIQVVTGEATAYFEILSPSRPGSYALEVEVLAATGTATDLVRFAVLDPDEEWFLPHPPPISRDLPAILLGEASLVLGPVVPGVAMTEEESALLVELEGKPESERRTRLAKLRHQIGLDLAQRAVDVRELRGILAGIAYLHDAATLAPSEPEIWLSLARLCQLAGDLAEEPAPRMLMEDALRQVLALDPENQEALERLTVKLVEDDGYREAMDLAEGPLAANPNELGRTELIQALAVAYLEGDALGRGIHFLGQVLEKAPAVHPVRVLRASLLRYGGDELEAARELRHVAETAEGALALYTRDLLDQEQP